MKPQKNISPYRRLSEEKRKIYGWIVVDSEETAEMHNSGTISEMYQEMETQLSGDAA